MMLRSKRLLSVWDRHTYSNQKRPMKKPIDGVFIYNSLFSVAAFASRTETTVSKKLAAVTADKLLLKLRSCRDAINKERQHLLFQIGDVSLNPAADIPMVEVKIDTHRYAPVTVMLIKTFQAYDHYFHTLHLAKMNGELTDTEQQVCRKQAINGLNTLLHDLNRSCLSFHRVRKEQEQKTCPS